MTALKESGYQRDQQKMKITGKTKLLGLIGSPVEHSKSPEMYNYCFEKFGLDYAYLAFDIPLEKTGDAIAALKLTGFRGANVTMPCKREVLKYMDELSPAARAIGAVNTIVNDNGRLTGHNTDGMGYTKNLERSGVSVKGKKIVLLGGGGAASAIAAQSALEGAAKISIFNLKDAFWDSLEATVKRIAEAVPGCEFTLNDLADKALLKQYVDETDILSNATKVGMAPHEEASLIEDVSWFRKDLVVTDAVYAPPKTRLLRDAENAGCIVCNGLGMLLCQGAEAFRLYTGEQMPIDEIKDLLYA